MNPGSGCSLFGFLVLVFGCTLLASPAHTAEERIVHGEHTSTYRGEVDTWARLDGDGEVLEVGVSLQQASIRNAPSEIPEGAKMGDPAMHPRVALLQFPDPVRATTWFEYFELNWNPQGHPPGVFSPPHFDFHFYARPYSEVREIDCSESTPPAAELMPAGYMIPWDMPMICAPEMGYHGADPAALEEPFTAVMIAGFYWGEMIFLEPMATREFMLRGESFTLEVPRPERLANSARYPTEFRATYLPGVDTWELVFSGFETFPGSS